MEHDASFGHWLTRRRAALHMSRAELARRACCATVTLRKIEEDARRPSPQLAAMLAAHLAISPAESKIFVRVARGELPIDHLPPADRPPVDIAQLTPIALPIPVSSLIGRDAVLATICDLIRRSDVRLLTLIGAPGIGKTRLSIRAAAEFRDAFSDGVWLIALAPLGDSSLVLPTIAQALGVAEAANVPLINRLAAAVRDRQMLLVLDNFEHVLQAASQLSVLLAAAPQLTILVTSRVALRLAGEQRLSVPPLDLPDLAQPLGREALGQYPAIELFVQRARAVDPQFVLSDANAPTVATICARLDGLPLAIELAATRMNLLTPAELLARLDQRFRLLSHGARDLPPRQQTLQRAIDWSYALLSTAERMLLQRLAVFMGGWSPAAASAVCALPNDASLGIGMDSELGIQEGVAALIDQSLVQRTQGRGGGSRFSMLESIREYALARLAEAGEIEQALAQHAAYFLELAELAECSLTTPEQRTWLDQLDQEHDNLRAALTWASQHNSEIMLRLAAALAEFWDTHGHQREGREWLTRALVPANLPPTYRAKALHGAGKLAHAQEDDQQAEALFVEGLTIVRALDDPHQTALLLNSLGELAFHKGDTTQAASMYSEGLALARATNDQDVIAQLLLGQGGVASGQGNLQLARACYTESLAICRALKQQRRMAWVLLALGRLAIAEGAPEHATARYAEGLALARSVGDQECCAWLLHGHGMLLLERPDLAGAARQLQESAWICYRLGASYGITLNLAGLVAIALQQQALIWATQLLSAMAHIWEQAAYSIPEPELRAEHDRALMVARVQLSAADFAAAWSAGQALTIERIVISKELQP